MGYTKAPRNSITEWNFDLSILQETIALAAQQPELAQHTNQTTGCICLMMDEQQVHLFSFHCLYPNVFEVAITHSDEETAVELSATELGEIATSIDVEQGD